MQDKNKEKVAEAKLVVARHLGVEIEAAAIHGSMLRGFNDPNSDIDICFLVNRPVSDYLNMTNAPFFEGTIDERRKKLVELSGKLSRELGWPIMVSILDMRSLLRGLMNCSTFSLMAYEEFVKENPIVKDWFGPILDDYFRVPNAVHRCGEHITNNMKTLRMIPDGGMEFKQERTYLGALWSAHRMLSYISGDRQHVRTINELVELNRAEWSAGFAEGFDRHTLGVIRARTERNPFESPRGVPNDAMELLKAFVAKVLKEAATYLREHPRRLPTVADEAREAIDLYGLVLDREDERNRPVALAA